jgi:hypothetical protein
LLEINVPLTFSGTGNKTFRDGIIGTSTFTLASAASGTFTISSSTAILGGASLTLVLNRTLNLTNGITVPSAANVTVTGSSTFGISKNSGNFLVGGTIDITDRTISNTSGNVTINGTLKTSKTNGFYSPGNIASGFLFINSGSTIEYNGTTAQSVTGTTTLGQSYYNITFSGSGTKTPISAVNVNTLGTVKITGASVTVDATLNNIGLTTANTTNFTMDAGRLILGTSPGTGLPLMDGTYNLTGGTIQYNGISAQTIRSKAYQNIEITSGLVSNSGGNITLNDNGTFIIKNSGVFTMRDNTITGSTGLQTVTVETGGTFKTENNEGFSGFIATLTNNSSLHQNIENIVLQSNSTVNYSRATPTSVSGNQPITNTVAYQNLIISGTDTKTASSGIITVEGNFSKSSTSTLAHNSGTVVFSNSAATQSFTNTSIPAFNFYNLINSNTETTTGLSIDGNLGVVNAFTLTSNSKLKLTTGNINIISTNAETGYITEIPATANIAYTGTGRFVVERYFPTHRAWRLMTAPVSTGAALTDNSFYNSYQAGGNNKLSNAGNGTYVSGANPDPSPTGNGLDITPLNNSSLKTFNSVTNLFEPVGNTRTKKISGNAFNPGLPDNTGFFMFVRGDRVNNPNWVTPGVPVNSTTLKDTGKLQVQSYTFPAYAAVNGYTLIGNPYASPVDFTKVLTNGSTSGIANRFWSWDPNLSAVGAYVYFDGAVSYAPVKVPVSASGTIGQTTIIQSKQAVFVQSTSASSPQVVFREADKDAANNQAAYRPMNNMPSAPMLAANIFYSDKDGNKVLLDGNMVQAAKEFSNDVNYLEDAIKFTNINENFAIKNKTGVLILDKRKPFTETDTINYTLTRTNKKAYQLQFIAGKISGNNLTGYLEDNFQKTSTPINMSGETWFDFAVSADAASADPNRFRVVFKKAIHCGSIKADLVKNDIAVEWSLINETDISNHEVERSADGINFIKVGAVNSKGNSTATTIYNWLDLQPATRIYYYRVKSIGLYGAIGYSETVKVKMVKSTPGMYVFPNPVTDGNIYLQLNLTGQGVYRIRLINAAGQELLKQIIAHSGGNATHKITSAQMLTKGTYVLEVMNTDKQKNILKVVIQ